MDRGSGEVVAEAEGRSVAQLKATLVIHVPIEVLDGHGSALITASDVKTWAPS
ncbi:MAG: hypothetical protein M3Y36_03140 [Actinomycetota bacterium]|nr:hypothetical protein [Actinomycetota bacterium]